MTSEHRRLPSVGGPAGPARRRRRAGAGHDAGHQGDAADGERHALFLRCRIACSRSTRGPAGRSGSTCGGAATPSATAASPCPATGSTSSRPTTTVISLDAATGKERWRQQAHGPDVSNWSPLGADRRRQPCARGHRRRHAVRQHARLRRVARSGDRRRRNGSGGTTPGRW